MLFQHCDPLIIMSSILADPHQTPITNKNFAMNELRTRLDL